jgi:hypothetical protein
VEKCERSSSPISELNIEKFTESSTLLHNNRLKISRIEKRSPIRSKLKRNKVYYEKKDFGLNDINLTKYQRVRKSDSKPKPNQNYLCTDCLESEKNRKNLGQSIPQIHENRAVVARSNNIPIFTIDTVNLNQKPREKPLNPLLKKVDIVEESLSECSISESLDCKLKRITISLN